MLATDNDQAGEQAAAELAAALNLGSKCFRLRPRGKDWNEDLVVLGLDALRSALRLVLPAPAPAAPVQELSRPELTLGPAPSAPVDRAAAISRLKQVRDTLAARLVAEEERLSVLDPADPERVQGEHYWQLDELEYRATCELLNGLHGLAYDRETVELAVLARTWRDLEAGVRSCSAG
jgi:hypothetical protein